MQSLYGFFQSEDDDMAKGERELLRSIDRTYELYLYLLLLPVELLRVAQNKIEIGKNKHLPTAEDLSPNLRFLNNRVIDQLGNNSDLKREAGARKLTWQTESEINILKKLWEEISGSDEYKKYMSSGGGSYSADQEFLLEVFKKFIADSEDFEHFIEEKNMHWPGDMNMCVAPTVIRTFENCNEIKEPALSPLFKDVEEDKQFVLDLFRKTIMGNGASQQLISEKTKNWEVERIALMDVILMKMAITELLHFTSVPVKVTLNEYIEISKTYSTPKSKQFINGILDKLVADFRKEDTMKKTGRGLIE
ncbi:MAG: transcription antitermination factor NusB [Bacteroidetes bacterium]|nr:transcription antitermination factor NusB [Bacteroidota bacterium]